MGATSQVEINYLNLENGLTSVICPVVSQFSTDSKEMSDRNRSKIGAMFANDESKQQPRHSGGFECFKFLIFQQS